MPDYLFPPAAVPELAIEGDTRVFPVGRIFCVGRNYEAHAAEMGSSVDREAPWYFTKSASAFAPSGGVLPYPPGTSNYHHEVELVLALGAPLKNAGPAEAEAAIWGLAVGLDMTRRDLQQVAKDNRRPWDLAKDVEGSAVIAPLSPVSYDPSRRISLSVNGQLRQEALLSEMVWSPVEILQHLSHFYHLQPGDLILTGTPAGVGAVRPGDRIDASVEGLTPLTVEIGALG